MPSSRHPTIADARRLLTRTFGLEDFPGGRYPRIEDLRAVYDSLHTARFATAPVPLSSVRDSVDSVAPAKLRLIVSLLKQLEVDKEHRGAHLRLLRPNLSGGELQAMADGCRPAPRTTATSSSG